MHQCNDMIKNGQLKLSGSNPSKKIYPVSALQFYSFISNQSKHELGDHLVEDYCSSAVGTSTFFDDQTEIRWLSTVKEDLKYLAPTLHLHPNNLEIKGS